MKKYLLLTSMIVLSTGIASARTIDFDTSIRWNTLVIKTSLNDVGLFGEYGYHYDVGATYHGILEELLELDSFSCKTAAGVCMKHCNESDLLRNGKGSSGRKCQDICTEFSRALIDNNNKNITYRKIGYANYDGDGMIFSDDKKFYALSDGGSGNYGIYEANSKKKIGTFGDGWYGEDGAYEIVTEIRGTSYDGWVFSLYSSHSLTVEYDEWAYVLGYRTLEQRYASDVAGKLDDVISLAEKVEKHLNDLRYKRIDNLDGVIASDTIKSQEWFQNINQEIYSIEKEIKAFQYATVTYDLYEKGLEYVETNRLDQINKTLRGFESELYHIDLAIDNAKCVRELFKYPKMFKYTTTETKEEAYNTIKHYCPTTGLNALTCSADKCKKMGDDKVKCQIGSLSTTFIFDDICQTEVEEKLGDFFYNF